MARRGAFLLGATIALILAMTPGCARRSGPKAIAVGSPCATCGMEIRDLRFACERETDRAYRQYDSIECLLQDGGPAAKGAVYLADYDAMTLHPVDSLWVVHGEFPTPMDGGLAAFRSRAAAEQVAAEARGTVGRWAQVAAAWKEPR